MKLIVLCTLCLISVAIASVIKKETEASLWTLELAQKEIERGGGDCIKENKPCDPKKNKCCDKKNCGCDSSNKKKKDKKGKNIPEDAVGVHWNCFCGYTPSG